MEACLLRKVCRHIPCYDRLVYRGRKYGAVLQGRCCCRSKVRKENAKKSAGSLLGGRGSYTLIYQGRECKLPFRS